MNNKPSLHETTLRVVETFCRRYEIRSLKVEKGQGITGSVEISDVTLILLKDAENNDEQEHIIEFKLQRESAGIFRYLVSIATEPELRIELGEAATRLDEQALNGCVQDFIGVITPRVKSALKEERVQNIRYVGNTFVLNNSTVFRVLSDEGEGRLNIEVLSEGQPMDAVLTASGLLDGLYLGSIQLVEN